MKDVTPPVLPAPPGAYEPQYFNQLLSALRLYFRGTAAAGPVAVTRINIDIGQLPTQADLADLRSGDIYRDTTAGDVLKIKP